jgi:hypothetical protein
MEDGADDGDEAQKHDTTAQYLVSMLNKSL